MQRLIDADHSDLFDVLSYVAFAKPPVPRRKRAADALSAISAELTDTQHAFVSFVLDQYVAQGVHELDLDRLPDLIKLRYSDMDDAIDLLGPPEAIYRVFTRVQAMLYQEAL